MALVLTGDNAGYGCSTHKYYAFRSDCEECVALSHLCRIYGVTPDELHAAIERTKEDRVEVDKTSGFWYNGF